MHLNLPATVLLLFATVLPAFPTAAQVELNPSHPETYTVRNGDTLWGIAGQFLRDPWRWPDLWESNREIGNPNRIYPGDVLHLNYREGQPKVSVQRGMHTVKLSPRVRVTPVKEPVPTIPIGAIRAFLTRAYVLDKAEIEKAPYVVDFPDEHVLAGLKDSIYVRSIFGGEGERFDVIRPGEAYQDPDSGDILGYKGQFVADATLERSGDPAKLQLTSVAMETIAGDRVVSASEDVPLQSFFPRPAPTGTQGRIISVLNGVSQIGQFNVVVLNLGSKDRLEPGHVYEVYGGGRRVRDSVRSEAVGWDWKNQKFWSQETWFGDHRVRGWVPEGQPGPDFPPRVDVRRDTSDLTLPFERSGVLLVFRTFPQVSFGLIMQATRPMHILDTVRPPER